MIRSLLIANRGEIALRVIRTAREMGIRTIAAYSDADAAARHVRAADAAVRIGGASPADSYLNVPRIIAAARSSAADAIHPGYGFLAENPAFAAACEEAGLAFVGPSSEALVRCGDKAEARRRAASAGVPIIPGTGALPDDAVEAAASQVGFPLLVKAASGGGGKGIHLAATPADLAGVVRLSRGEAMTAFGDDRVYLERYLPSPHHVEVQIVADRDGRVLHLGERECSVQRRHQKAIEESPSPSVSPELRARLWEAGVRAAQAVGYRNAGTVEFLVQGEEFFFLEINARLQVEHPVTEMVTGLDLVRLQLDVASGSPLPIRQNEVRWRGHAVECRISAEDPHRQFLPSLGTISGVVEPGGPGIRVDGALAPGTEVTRHYDPLLAKVIAWGETRDQALDRMRRALGEMQIGGLSTTIPFHLWALDDPAFRAGAYTTQFVDERWERRERGTRWLEAAVVAASVLSHRERTRLRIPTVSPSRWRGRA